MSLSMYQASAPVFLRALDNLSAILTKGEASAAARKVDPAVLLQSRLYADMLPLTKQVQIVSDTIKGAIARLSGIENPSFADTETTFAELQERISKTAAFVKAAKEKDIDGTEQKAVTIKSGGKDVELDGQSYLLHFAIPNLFFHVATAYGILRHNGVELGKKDFLGNK